jgi:tRNA-dihydrouridine synthase B
MARKHISWYTKGLAGSAVFRHAMNQLQTCAEQLAAVDEFFGELASVGRRLIYVEELAA